MKRYGIRANWTAKSLALHTQAVLQGAFILAKAKGGADIAVSSADHLRRYIELLFQPNTRKGKRHDIDYLALFTGNRQSARTQAFFALPEAERKAKEQEGIAAWGAWMQKHQDAIVFGGGPLGKTKLVSPERHRRHHQQDRRLRRRARGFA